MNQIDIRPIDANALMRKACEKFYTTDYYNHISKMIEDAPTITLKPQRTGRWIPQKGGGLCCSECGGYALDEPDGNFVHVAVPSKFCPHCGARMEGDEE